MRLQAQWLNQDADVFRDIGIEYRGWSIKRRIYKKSLIFYIVKDVNINELMKN